jgi:cholest-4-en-3-one 26-monooxygenase
VTDIDPLDLVDPERYARNGYPHDTWTRLRAEAPVAYIEAPGFKPFWAITKHADIMQISSQPERFSNAQGITLARAGQPPIPPSEMLVLVDPPRHGPMRRVVNARFTPRAVRARRDDVERISRDVLDDAAGSCEANFVERIAAPFPLAVIAWILGVPSDDWPPLFRWTNEVIGKDDPEYRQPGETAGQTAKRARTELHRYLLRPHRGASARATRRPRD